MAHVATVLPFASRCERVGNRSARVVASGGCGRLRRLSRSCRWAPLWLIGVGAILAAPGFGWSTGQPRLAGGGFGSAPGPSAEVAFQAPRRFAVVTESSSKRQRIYGVGDILPAPKGDSGEYQVTQIEDERLQLTDLRTGKATWIAVGNVVPGRFGRRVTGMRALRTIEYRFIPTGRSLDAEPRIVELREGHVALEVEVPDIASGPPASALADRPALPPSVESADAKHTLEQTLLGRVRVTPTGDGSYDINAADLNAALERGAQLVAEAWPKVWPTVSSRNGIGLRIESPIADGTLGPRGFRVTIPNLAERGGLQVGDVILGVNGQPVNSFADVYRVYSQIRRDPRRFEIQLELERQGQPLTKTYRIR